MVLNDPVGEDMFKDSTTTATAMVASHPEIACGEPTSAAYIHNNIIGTQSQAFLEGDDSRRELQRRTRGGGDDGVVEGTAIVDANAPGGHPLPLQNLLHTEALSAAELGIVLLISTGVFWAVEIEKAVRRRMEPEFADS